jgi:hypothetical protein
MTKVAVLWAGGIRDFRRTWSNYRGAILQSCRHGDNDLEVDLYVSTYESEDVEEFTELYQPVHIDVESLEKVTAKSQEAMLDLQKTHYDKWPESNPISTVSTLYKLDRVYKTFEKHSLYNYDYVVRYRDRILLSHQLDHALPPVGEYGRGILIPQFGNWKGGLCDVFAVGSELQMKKYHCGILDNLYSYLEQGCYLQVENILLWHLVAQNIKLIRKPYGVSILQETPNKDLDTATYTKRFS